jgi:hypothetical protein
VAIGGGGAGQSGEYLQRFAAAVAGRARDPTEYGDGGVEQVGCKSAFCQRSIDFTDGATLVKISVRTAPDQTDLMNTTAETLAEAQHELLLSLSDE